ncbi:MAG: flippase [Archaeoglobaceae archaeon]|nr:flippase [Archaeoglobaceae archaeon]MDW8118861.1 flippase [Archaeoglobaceae archaeon]
MLGRLVLKNTIYSSSSMLIANLTGLITIIFLARALKPELFGLYSLSLSTVAILSIFSDLGIKSATTRYIADAMAGGNYRLAGGYLRFLLNLKLALTILVALSLFILSDSIAELFNKPISIPLQVLSIYLVFNSLSSLLIGVANAMNDFKADLISYTLSGVSKLFLTISLVLLGLSLFGAILAVAISTLIAFLFISYYIIKKYRIIFVSVEEVEKGRIVRFIFFTSLISLQTVIFANVDIVMIGYFLKAEDVAYYRASFSIVSAVISLIFIPAVLMPIFVKLEDDDLARAFSRAFKYSSVLCIPSAFGLMLISENLLIFAYGEDYLPGLFAMQILCILLLSPVLGIYGSIFSGKERPELNFFPLLFSMFLNVLLNYLMIPIYGINGAAFATVLSYVVSWIVAVYIGIREFGIYPRVGDLTKPLFSAILMFLFARNFQSMLLIIPIAIFIYSIVLFAIRGVNREDIEYIRKIGKI